MLTARSSAARASGRRPVVALAVALAALLALAGCGLDADALAAGQPAKADTAEHRRHEPETSKPATAPTSAPDPEVGPDERNGSANDTRSVLDAELGDVTDPGAQEGNVFGGAIRATEAEETFTLETTISMDTGSESQQINLSGAVDRGSEPRLSLLAESSDRSEEVRIDGDEAWYASDRSEFAEVLPAGIEWIHVSGEDDIAADAEATGRVLIGPLSYLAGAQDVEHTGSSSVDGEELQTYTFTLDLESVGQAPEQHNGLQGLIIDGAAMSVSGEVDIDAQGRVRRVHTAGDITMDGVDIGHLDIEARYGDFGTAVDIETPADEVTIDATGDPDLLALAAGQIS